MIEIERTQIQFISDVLLAVAVLASSVIWCYLILTSKNIIRVLIKTLSHTFKRRSRDTDSYTLFSPRKVKEDIAFLRMLTGEI